VCESEQSQLARCCTHQCRTQRTLSTQTRRVFTSPPLQVYGGKRRRDSTECVNASMQQVHPFLRLTREHTTLHLFLGLTVAATQPTAHDAAIGRLCEKCDGKCVICDSYVRPCTLVRICDECNYGSYEGRCVICGGQGISDAYYCKECTQQEKDVRGSSPSQPLLLPVESALKGRAARARRLFPKLT